MSSRTHEVVLKELRGSRECPAPISKALLRDTTTWKVELIPSRALVLASERTRVVAMATKAATKNAGEDEEFTVPEDEWDYFDLWVEAPVDVVRLGRDGTTLHSTFSTPWAAGFDDLGAPPGGLHAEEARKAAAEFDEELRRTAAGRAAANAASAAAAAAASRPKLVLTDELRDELRKQKATEPIQLTFTSSSIYLMRPSSKVEVAPLNLGDPPATSPIIQKAVKVKGASCLVTILEAARASGDLTVLDAAFQRLVESLSSMIDDYTGYAATASARITQMYSRAKGAAINSSVVITYLEELLLRDNAGRGLPKLFDDELMMRCNRSVLAQLVAGGGSAKITALEATLAAVQSQLQDLTAHNSRLSADLATAVADLASVRSGCAQSRDLSSIRSDVSGLRTRLDRVEPKVNSLSDNADNARSDRNIVCSNCGQRGHRAANCNNPPAGQQQQAANAQRN